MFEISGELIDLNHKNRFSRSALSEACYELSTHSPDVLDFLLSRGADPLGPGTSGGTCLNTAVQTLGEGAFDKESSSDFFVILMRAIAEAQATKDQNKLVSREELYGLNVLDDDKHTPLSRAKTLCFIRRKIFHAALVECGFYIDLFPPGEECPNFTPGDRRVLCFLYSDLDSIYQSRIDSGGEKSQDGVSANDACEGAAFERGGTDGSLWLSNTDELVSTYAALMAGLSSDALQARRSLPGFQLTFNTGRDEHWDDQVMQSPSHQPTVLTHPSSNPQDDITGVVTLAADSTPSTSTPNLSLPGIRELFRVSDVGRLQATSWDDPLRHDRYTDRYITTPPSVTPNRRFSSQDFSFQANIPASESFALLRIWIDPSTANALQENVWSTPMELHPDAVSPSFFFYENTGDGRL